MTVETTAEPRAHAPSEAPRAPTAPARRRLPHRRLTETRQVVHRSPDGRETPLSVSIGYDPVEPARPREVFYDAGYRSGADLEFVVQDLCVIVSLLLQHGVDPQEIGRSLSVSYGADDTARHGSLAGTIVAELLMPPQWVTSDGVEEGRGGEAAAHPIRKGGHADG